MKLILLFVLSLSLFSCGGESENVDSFEISISESLEDFSSIMSLSSDTPEGLGSLLVINNGHVASREIGACTWFLIDKEYALTNSHCIPDDLKKNKELDCGNYLQGVISTGNGRSEKRKCVELIYFSHIDEKSTHKNNDYALIKIMALDIDTFNFSRNGVSETEELQLGTMDHNISRSRVFSKYNPKECTVNSSDLFGTIKSSGSSPLTVFGDCKVIQGNSGSPVVSQNGDVVGIVHGGVRNSASFKNTFRSSNIDVKTSSAIGIITNLKCFKLGMEKFDKAMEKDCSFENQASSDLQERIESKIVESYTKKLKKIRKNLPQYIEFEEDFKAYGTRNSIFMKPKCIKSLDKWNDEDRDKIKNEGFTRKTISFTTATYSLETQIVLDFYGNFTAELKQGRVKYSSYKISNLQKLKSDKAVKAKVKNDLSRSSFETNTTIPMCNL